MMRLNFAGLTLLMSLSVLPVMAEFVHPGVAHSEGSIEFVKGKIGAEEEPWAPASNLSPNTATPSPSCRG